MKRDNIIILLGFIIAGVILIISFKIKSGYEVEAARLKESEDIYYQENEDIYEKIIELDKEYEKIKDEISELKSDMDGLDLEEISLRREELEDLKERELVGLRDHTIFAVENFNNSLLNLPELEGEVETMESRIFETLSGGSSTLSASMESLYNSFLEGDFSERALDDAFSAGLKELPNELEGEVLDVIFGETIMKTVDVVGAFLENRQIDTVGNYILKKIPYHTEELGKFITIDNPTEEDFINLEIQGDEIHQIIQVLNNYYDLNANEVEWLTYITSIHNTRQVLYKIQLEESLLEKLEGGISNEEI